jgi:hypothetical protein
MEKFSKILGNDETILADVVAVRTDGEGFETACPMPGESRVCRCGQKGKPLRFMPSVGNLSHRAKLERPSYTLSSPPRSFRRDRCLP